MTCLACPNGEDCALAGGCKKAAPIQSARQIPAPTILAAHLRAMNALGDFLNSPNKAAEMAMREAEAAFRAMLSASPQPPQQIPADVAKDAARLDWLDANNLHRKFGWKVSQSEIGNVTVSSIIYLGGQHVPTIREAIDAAIAAQGEQL